MKLIEMTDYVLNNIEKVGYGKCQVEFVATVKNYANFLKQPLRLDMFVPCDENGNIIEEPCYSEPKSENEIGYLDELIYQYNLAKQSVIFEYNIIFNDWNNQELKGKTIEDLLSHGIDYFLNENAIKLLGL